MIDSGSEATPAADAADRTRLRGYVRSTVRHGSVYLVGMVLARLAGFIMLPVYTRVLTPSEFGVLEILGHTTDILSMLAGLGIGTAVMRYYYRFETESERHAVISTALILLIGVFTVVASLGFVFAQSLSDLLLGEGGEARLVRLSVIILVLGSTIEVPLIVMRARQDSAAAVTAGLARLLIALACNLIFVLGLRLGVAGVLYSTIISTSLVGGYLLVGLLRETGLRFTPTIARTLVAFGAPLVVWEIGSFVLHFSDRYFLRIYDSFAVVGLYSLSYKLAMLIPWFVTGPFSSIWLPKALEIERAEGPNAVPIMAAIQGHYNLVLVSVAFGLALFSRDLIHLATGAAFHSADQAMPLLALAMVFFGYRQVAQIGSIIRERPGVIARSTAIAAGAALVLNLLLIPRWGMMGAAAATLGAFGLEFFIMRWHSMRLYPLHVDIGLLPLGLGAVVWSVARMVGPSSAGTVASIAVNALAFGVFVLLLSVTGGLTADQKRFLSGAVRDPLGSLRAMRGT